MEEWCEFWLCASLWKLLLYDASRSSSMIMGVKLIAFSGIFPLVRLTSAFLNPLPSWLSSKYSACCNKTWFFWCTTMTFPFLLASNSQSPLGAIDLKIPNEKPHFISLSQLKVKSPQTYGNNCCNSTKSGTIFRFSSPTKIFSIFVFR